MCTCVCDYCDFPYVFRGLLGGHSMAVMLKDAGHYMQWYQDELLHMAKDVGLRLLPAFNTSSGLPYPRVSHQTIHKATAVGICPNHTHVCVHTHTHPYPIYDCIIVLSASVLCIQLLQFSTAWFSMAV